MNQPAALTFTTCGCLLHSGLPWRGSKTSHSLLNQTKPNQIKPNQCPQYYIIISLHLPVDFQSESPPICAAQRSHTRVWSPVRRRCRWWLWCFLAVWHRRSLRRTAPPASLQLNCHTNAHRGCGGSSLTGCKLPHLMRAIPWRQRGREREGMGWDRLDEARALPRCRGEL